MTSTTENPNGNKSAATLKSSGEQRRRSSIPLTIVAALFVIGALMTWYLTWFGRGLNDQEITEYLSDTSKPRRVQHALSQIAERIASGDQAAKQWYARIIDLSRSDVVEVRLTASWAMGQDNRSQEFHEALLNRLRSDPEPIVRRNAAIQLVRFGDGSGHMEIVAILEPIGVTAPSSGVIINSLPVGLVVRRNALLAKIDREAGGVVIRAPIPGKIASNVERNRNVAAGDRLFEIASDEESVWEALRALYYVGKAEDLEKISAYIDGDSSDRVKKQAALTVQAIQSRAQNT